MRSLHVAALPFPTHQGTQALLHSMLGALVETGHETHLFCYGDAAFERPSEYTVHRLSGPLRANSVRSGPALRKIALDALLCAQLPGLIRRVRPDVLVAHHVEAALACARLRGQRWIFLAHTSLSAELQTYFPRPAAALCMRVGRSVDRKLCRAASRVLTVSPLLSQRLSAESGVTSFALRLPWSLAAPLSAGERAAARAELGYAAEDEVVLYAGNLDAYQGLGVLAEGIRRLARERPRLCWLVATQSTPQAMRTLRVPHTRLRFSSLGSERVRRLVYAAADVAVVPRQSPGGLPIKLLDALARGQSVVAARRAAAGLPLDSVCTLIADDDPAAWQMALATHFASDRRTQLQREARAYLAREHANAAFVSDFRRHVAALGQVCDPK